MRKTSGRAICCSLAVLMMLSGTATAADVNYRVVPGESEIRILVFRAGALSNLGHNHVVSTTDVTGTVVTGEVARRLELRIPVMSLIVDDPDARAEEGLAFASVVSEKDREATRANMLGKKLLGAAEYDEIRVVSDRVSGELPTVTVTANITIRGARHVVELPALVEVGADRLVASGRAQISHAELGLSPFTAAFGTLRVGEQMTLYYRIVARSTADEL